MTPGFIFRAGNGQWYAVNAAGEQSPSFRTEQEASSYLSRADKAVA